MTAIGHAVLVFLASLNGYLINADRGNAFGLVLLLTLPAFGVYFLGWWALATFFIGTVLGGKIYWSAVAAGRAGEGDQTPKSAWDALQENPLFQQQKALFDVMSALCEDGIDADEFPDGRGEFGLTATNPIPCKTTFGSTAYLSSLRTLDGLKVAYKRIGSLTVDISPHPIDAYEISNSTGQKITTLYISPYQKRISSKAPRGFALAPPPGTATPKSSSPPSDSSPNVGDQEIWLGGLVIDNDNHVLLRKQNDKFYFEKWTLPLRVVAQPEITETAALSTVHAQTGYRARVICELKDTYRDNNSHFRYFLMSPESAGGEFDRAETTETQWANWWQAERLLKRNMHQSCRERDLRVVQDGLSTLSAIALGAAPKELSQPIPHEISDDELRLIHIPRPDDNIDVLTRFALTFDGYRHFDFQECASISEQVGSADNLDTQPLTDLRVALFFAQRAIRHVDMGVPDRGTCAWMRRLVEAIRRKVPA